MRLADQVLINWLRSDSVGRVRASDSDPRDSSVVGINHHVNSVAAEPQASIGLLSCCGRLSELLSVSCTENHCDWVDRNVVESGGRARIDHIDCECDCRSCCELWLCSKRNSVYKLHLERSSFSVLVRLNLELHLVSIYLFDRYASSRDGPNLAFIDCELAWWGLSVSDTERRKVNNLSGVVDSVRLCGRIRRISHSCECASDSDNDCVKDWISTGGSGLSEFHGPDTNMSTSSRCDSESSA